MVAAQESLPVFSYVHIHTYIKYNIVAQSCCNGLMVSLFSYLVERLGDGILCGLGKHIFVGDVKFESEFKSKSSFIFLDRVLLGFSFI